MLSIFNDLFGDYNVWDWLSFICNTLMIIPFVGYAVIWLYRRMGWSINGGKMSRNENNDSKA